MLAQLAIRDYAIIDQLDLEFGNGFTVLTGETGAGKSIIVDALGLVLGDRADSAAVRHGATRAEITAAFELDSTPAARAWLIEQDIDAEECVLRRVISADGRSRGYINGSTVTLGQLRELGEHLVDIHGQHEHQSLLRRAEQLALLDAHGGNAKALAAVAAAYDEWHAADAAWRSLAADASERADRVELLRFQVRELAALALTPGEMEELQAEHSILANAGRLQEAAQAALTLADGDEETHARSLLHGAVQALIDVAGVDQRLDEVRVLLEQAQLQLGEGADDLRRWLDRFESDPERLATIEQRIATAQSLARKHRTEATALPALLESLQAELDDLDHADERIQERAAARDAAAASYRDTATRLGTARTSAAKSLGKAVTGQMQVLGMEGGRFAVTVTHDQARFSRDGADQVEFTVATNAGQPDRPLAKTASGGELSRIALGIQVTAAHAATIGCLVFDEVDAGVGGAVAAIVGERLRALADGRQVLCVTHLPQVAAQAHHHFRVAKSEQSGVTLTAIEPLDTEQRVDELARMLGGLKVTAKVRATAREMIEAAS